MANYIKATNFAVKDSLTTGDPAKVVKGTEIDTEFTNIAAAIASKVESDSPVFTGTPTAPTASTGTENTQIATTAYVANKIGAISAGVTSFNAGTTGLTPNTSTTGNVTLAGTLALANGGTGSTTASAARTALGVPSTTGTGASGTWGISITGNAATATTATTVTTNQVLSATAGASVDSVGTYAWCRFQSSTAISAGSTASGSSLWLSGVNSDASGNSLQGNGGTPSGTWRAMGSTLSGYANGSGTIWLRIS